MRQAYEYVITSEEEVRGFTSELKSQPTSFLPLEATRLAVTIIPDQVHILSEPLPPLRLCCHGSVR